MSKKDKKEKKEKVTYIDDGRSLADMSSVRGGMDWTKQGTMSSPKEIIGTFFGAMKMMVLPTLVAVGFIAALYFVITLLFGMMS